jgi:hypothetical protein
MSYSAAMGTTGQLDYGTPGGAGASGLSLGLGTGQQGTQTVDQSDTNPVVAVWSWINTPFDTPMSPWSVALLVGVVLVAIIGWNLVLYHIRIAAETL